MILTHKFLSNQSHCCPPVQKVCQLWVTAVSIRFSSQVYIFFKFMFCNFQIMSIMWYSTLQVTWNRCGWNRERSPSLLSSLNSRLSFWLHLRSHPMSLFILLFFCQERSGIWIHFLNFWTHKFIHLVWSSGAWHCIYYTIRLAKTPV